MSAATTANVSPFAHLGKAGITKAEDGGDDKDKKENAKAKKAEDDKKEEEAQAKKAEEDKKKEDEAKAKKAEEDKKKEDDAKAKKAEEDGKDKKDDDKAQARADERKRIRTIVLSDPGKELPVAAMHMALETDLSADNAIGTLSAMLADKTASGSNRRAGLHEKMASTDQPDVGNGGGGSEPNLAQQIVLAGKKRRGEKD